MSDLTSSRTSGLGDSVAPSTMPGGAGRQRSGRSPDGSGTRWTARWAAIGAAVAAIASVPIALTPAGPSRRGTAGRAARLATARRPGAAGQFIGLTPLGQGGLPRQLHSVLVVDRDGLDQHGIAHPADVGHA